MNYFKQILLSCFLFFGINANTQVLVKDFNPGTNNSVEDYGTKSIQLDDKIFFIASVDGTNQGLYVLANEKIELLKEVCSNCASYSQLFIHKGKLFFTDTENGIQNVYETDGTKENLKLAFTVGENRSILLPSENKIYYYIKNLGINIYENGVSKLIPNTQYLAIENGNSADANRALVDEDKILMVTKPKSDTVALIEITDKVTILGKLNVDFGSDYQHSLKKVKNGYIFIYDGKLYNYKTSTKSIVNFSSLTGSVLRILDFKPNQPILYVYNNGIFVVNDTETLAVTKISNIWNSVVQGTEFARAQYGDKMLLLTSDFNTSFKDYALLTDGTASGTIANKIITYSSALVQKGKHVFFAGGITNGFEPSIYYFDMEKTAPVEIKAFTESSNNLTSIMPIGVIGTKLYYFSNLDTKYGRELYYINTNIKTKTEDNEIVVEDYFNLTSFGNEYTVETKGGGIESLEFSIYDINGKIIKSFTQNSGESFNVPNINQLILILVKSKQSSKQGIFKTLNH